MDLAKQKEAAAAFLRALDKLDPATLANLVSDNFEFEMMGRLPGVKPILGKHKFLSNMPKTLITLFPNGLNMKLLTVVAEGPHVAIQAEFDTVAGNGKKYANPTTSTSSSMVTVSPGPRIQRRQLGARSPFRLSEAASSRASTRQTPDRGALTAHCCARRRPQGTWVPPSRLPLKVGSRWALPPKTPRTFYRIFVSQVWITGEPPKCS